MTMTPKQSFQHTLREISVNRANPCELPRELISNAYDAGAGKIFVFPLVQKRGLLFFDNGMGLSASESAKKNDVVPYVAFFSIGKGTKTAGQQIGYKCQGSKLCFASRRFSVITRCAGEDAWRWKTIDNPKQTLDLHYDLTPAETVTPWRVLGDTILPDADERTSAILEVLGESFFRDDFQHGTLLIIEDFETDSYDSYFSVEEPHRNYLYNYIRLYSVHGDVRRISKEHGFTASDVRAVRALLKPDTRCDLRFWIVRDTGRGELASVPQGWPYLERSEESAEPPSVVQQLRSARFQARHATTFKFADRHYSIILAIDGNRRAHEEYPMLGRRGPNNARSGIALSDIRGALLASKGIVVCQYRQIFDHPLLEDWSILQYGSEHYTLIIDGTFELVTNRDALAPSSLAILRDQEFVKQIKSFLQGVRQTKEGDVLAQLVDRLNRETTRHQENQYLEDNSRLRRELPERETFVVKRPEILNQRFFAPLRGEEHFVGALYTLFAHMVSDDLPAAASWSRPLTFSGLGIDALAVLDESKPINNGNLLAFEYKYAFSADEGFNHPLSITDRIICWQFSEPKEGESVKDSYKYQGTVQKKIVHGGQTIGFVIGDIRSLVELKDISHEVVVLSLRALLIVSFGATFRSGAKILKPASKAKRTRA